MRAPYLRVLCSPHGSPAPHDARPLYTSRPARGGAKTCSNARERALLPPPSASFLSSRCVGPPFCTSRPTPPISTRPMENCRFDRCVSSRSRALRRQRRVVSCRDVSCRRIRRLMPRLASSTRRASPGHAPRAPLDIALPSHAPVDSMSTSRAPLEEVVARLAARVDRERLDPLCLGRLEVTAEVTQHLRNVM